VSWLFVYSQPSLVLKLCAFQQFLGRRLGDPGRKEVCSRGCPPPPRWKVSRGQHYALRGKKGFPPSLRRKNTTLPLIPNVTALNY